MSKSPYLVTTSFLVAVHLLVAIEPFRVKMIQRVKKIKALLARLL